MSAFGQPLSPSRCGRPLCMVPYSPSKSSAYKVSDTLLLEWIMPIIWHVQETRCVGSTITFLFPTLSSRHCSIEIEWASLFSHYVILVSRELWWRRERVVSSCRWFDAADAALDFIALSLIITGSEFGTQLNQHVTCILRGNTNTLSFVHDGLDHITTFSPLFNVYLDIQLVSPLADHQHHHPSVTIHLTSLGWN